MAPTTFSRTAPAPASDIARLPVMPRPVASASPAPGSRASIYWWGSPPGSHASRFGNLAIVLFFIAQAADGVLTYVGLHTTRLVGEGNPLLAWLITAIGTGPALAGAKLSAAGLGMILHLTAVHRIVFSLTVLYALAAILPWAAILLHTDL